MSYGMGLGSALKALNAARMGIQTSGHNVANVNTPGYTRQRVLQSASFPFTDGRGLQIGRLLPRARQRSHQDEGKPQRRAASLDPNSPARVPHAHILRPECKSRLPARLIHRSRDFVTISSRCLGMPGGW